MKGLNNRFDTSKDIIDELVADSRGYFIEDAAFSQAIDEYDTEEELVMEKMMESTKYGFKRVQNGFDYFLKGLF